MARSKSYDYTKDYVVDKDVAFLAVENELLNFVLNMFEYENLPDTIPKYNLEKYLMTIGYCGVVKVDGNLYALDGTLGGKPNVYHEPTQFIYANEVLGSDTVDECKYVLCKNDYRKQGLMPIINRYTHFMVESNITMRTILMMCRMNILLSASDEKTKASAESYLNKVESGQLGIIAESAFFDGVRMQNANTSSNYVTQVVELMQFIKGSFLQTIGVNSQHNMKREYVNKGENGLNDDGLRPFVDNMLECRKQFVSEINETFGTEIKVDFNSVWKSKQLEQGISSQLEKEESDEGLNEDIVLDTHNENNEEHNEELRYNEESDYSSQDVTDDSTPVVREKKDELIQEDFLEHGQYRGNDYGHEDSSEGHSESDRDSEPVSEGRLLSSERNERNSGEGTVNEDSSQLDEGDAVNDESEQKSSTSKDAEINEEDEGRKTNNSSSESDEEKDK